MFYVNTFTYIKESCNYHVCVKSLIIRCMSASVTYISNRFVLRRMTYICVYEWNMWNYGNYSASYFHTVC